MADFVVYDVADGRVLRSGFCSDADVELQPQGSNEAVALAVGPVRFEEHFIVNGEVRPRPDMELRIDRGAVSIGEVASISGVPENCALAFGGETYHVSDGVVEWSSSLPGRYELLFACFPFRDETVVVEVVE